MEQRLHQFSVRQCRTFRLFSLRCIKTWWDLRWQRLLASRPSWTKQRGWTSWSSAFTLCSRSNLRLNPLSHMPLYFCPLSSPITNVLAGGKRGARVPDFSHLCDNRSNCPSFKVGPRSEFGCVCPFASSSCKATEACISSRHWRPSTKRKHVQEKLASYGPANTALKKWKRGSGY